MALDYNTLAIELAEALKQDIKKTVYDPITGKKTIVAETIKPTPAQVAALAKTLINHITSNSEIVGVQSSVTVTTVNATVAPGIPVTTTGGPGTTTGPGTAQGTGNGTSKQNNLVRVK